MTEQDFLQMERFFRGEMEEAERLAFEQRLATDPAFAREVWLHRKALDAIRLYGRAAYKKKLQERPPVAPERGRLPFRFVYLTLLLLVVFFIGWCWKNDQPASTNGPQPEKSAPPADMLRKPPDTAPAGKTPLPPASKPAETRPPVARQTTDPGLLFAGAFKAYSDETFQIQVRAETDQPTPYEQFIRLYAGEKYPECLEAFERLSPTLQTNDNTLFVKANALLASGRAAEAAVLLDGILTRRQCAYLEQAPWYLALAALKTGDLPRARQRLQSLASDSKSPRRDDARRLLRQLGER